MDTAQNELIKQRDISFCVAGTDEGCADAAVKLLSGVDGIINARPLNEDCLNITYDLSKISLCIIEEALQEIGFQLDNSLLCKIRRAIYYYTEETQLVNMGHVHDDSKSTTSIFISQYELRKHGCRDQRPPYYHHYQ